MVEPMNAKIENDLRPLRGNELDAIAGGADTQSEQKTFGTLTSVFSTGIKTIGDALQTIARAG
jgi:hypothetical protein